MLAIASRRKSQMMTNKKAIRLICEHGVTIKCVTSPDFAFIELKGKYYDISYPIDGDHWDFSKAVRHYAKHYILGAKR